jgi:hypothetical protein
MTPFVAAKRFVSGLRVHESIEFWQQLDPGLFQSR